MNSINIQSVANARSLTTHADIVIDKQMGTSTLYMKPDGRPCFTNQLLQDIALWQGQTRREVQIEQEQRLPPSLRYAVLASSVHPFFNVGGDLNHFANCIRNQDRNALTEYGIKCIDVAHAFSVGLDVGLTTIALIQGNALGGGFESALAANVIIAERGVKMGFPEVLFNLFPGMGAYSFLSRRVAPGIAERMILSGDLYSAEELYEMGIVNILCESGEGEDALHRFIRSSEKRFNAQRLISRTRAEFNRVPYEELVNIVRMWVDCAMSLSDKDVKTMERLVRAQNKQTELPAADMANAAKSA